MRRKNVQNYLYSSWAFLIRVHTVLNLICSGILSTLGWAPIPFAQPSKQPDANLMSNYMCFRTRTFLLMYKPIRLSYFSVADLGRPLSCLLLSWMSSNCSDAIIQGNWCRRAVQSVALISVLSVQGNSECRHGEGTMERYFLAERVKK